MTYWHLTIAGLILLVAVQLQAEIRVGTTADYEPFSFRDNGELVGIDIDLARDFGRSIDEEVVFVITSWPNLLRDLADSKFDLAMSGISRSPERAAAARLSSTYFVTGKTPLARCDLDFQIQALADLNRPSVRVIVNPGGTNERFVTQHLSAADVTIHPENLTVFDALAAGQADVMITDAIEAHIVAGRDPRLCVPMTTPFTRIEKVVLLPRRSPHFDAIEQWLRSRTADGTIAAAIDRYVPNQ